MELNLCSTSLIYPNINVVFDDSIFQVDEDSDFVLTINEGFNANITFPSYANSVRIGGTPYNFNYPIMFPSSVQNVSNCFRNCNNFNQSVTIPVNMINCCNMFYGCSNFNQPVNIPNSVRTMYDMFCYCRNFNQPITLPLNLETAYDTFFNCVNFNSPVTIPNGIKSIDGLFRYASNYNLPVTIPNNVSNCNAMFERADKFNSPVNIGINVNASRMFATAINYNQPTTFNGCYDVSYSLRDCIIFNSPVTFSPGTVNCEGVFHSALYFNRHVFLPSGVETTSLMFLNAKRFNSIVVIPSTVMYATQMFSGINGANYNIANSTFSPASSDVLMQPIYLYAQNLVSATNLFGSGASGQTVQNVNLYVFGLKNNFQMQGSIHGNGTFRKNIFTDDRGMDILRNTKLYSNSTLPVWTNDTTNGCIYNASTGVYVYNNWDGVVPNASDYNYHHVRYFSNNGESIYQDEYICNGNNGEFIYGDNKWSNVPNGQPVTGILNNITENKNVYYAGIYFDYVRQRYGLLNYFINNQGITFTTNGAGTGIILNGADVSGVAFKKTIYSGGNQSGHCQQTAALPSIVTSGTGRIDYGTPASGHYYANNTTDIFLTATNGMIQAAVTFRNGPVADNGVRIQTETNASSNFAVNVTIANNEPVTLPYGSASTNTSYGGLINVRYASSSWNVTAIAPVTDGINNYSAGQVIRTWSGSAWNALTVWAQ